MDIVPIVIAADIGIHATKKFIDVAIDLGGKFIEQKYLHQQPKAIETANANYGQYLNKLAFRVKEIEDRLTENDMSTDQIEVAFQNPDIALDYKEIAIFAARTNESTKHNLFAKLLADKLISPKENIYSLTTASAIQAISKLNIEHLRLLSIIVLLYHVRPQNRLVDNKSEFLIDWLSSMYGFLNPGAEISKFHFNHLMTTSCLIPTGGLAEDPKSFFVRRFESFEVEKVKEFLTYNSFGQKINNLYNIGIIGSTLSTTGRLIGKNMFEILVKENVQFVDWE